jgi:hypothetical protein
LAQSVQPGLQLFAPDSVKLLVMRPEEWSRILAASVVPVVIISACGLLCLAFYNRLASIVSRLRGFQRERLEEQQEYARGLFAGQLDKVMLARHHRILEMLETQTARVIRRARLIRLALFFLLATIACLTLSSLATGLSIKFPVTIYAAACFFYTSMILLLTGIILAIVEIKGALEPVELESRFVDQLTKEFATLDDEKVHA